MIGIVLASHGEFAKGILQSSQMVYGEEENISACCLMPSEGSEDFRRKLEQAIAAFEDSEQVLFLCDLWGGTPFNQACTLLDVHKDNWAIVSGMNLAMVVDALDQRGDAAQAQELAAKLISTGRDAVKAMPASIECAPTPKTEAKAVRTKAIPEGTVLGNGKIDIVLARVDTRLLHGQVATAWSKAYQADRIIVVSDAVAHDDLRKSLIVQAAPPGMKAHVVPISKMIQVAKDPRFGTTKALLLFEKPQDALRTIEGGVEIKSLNIGSMAHSKGKVAVSKALSVETEDLKTFARLKELGVQFDVRKIPGDAPDDMEKLLAYAAAKLKANG